MDCTREEIDKLLGDAIREVRRISHDLNPPMLELMSLSDLVESYLDSWKSNLNILYYRNIDVGITINKHLKTHIVRILQELVINIYKHAESRQVQVYLRITNLYVCVIVCDDGRGYDTLQEIPQGMGLANIKLRVRLFNGEYKVKSSQKGTTSIFLFNLIKSLNHEKNINCNSG